MTREQERSVCARAISRCGSRAQLLKAAEECAELIHALMRYAEAEKPTQAVRVSVCEEAADVEIMITQLRMIFSDETVDSWKDAKLARLAGRLEMETK